MAASPRFKLYKANGEYVGAMKYAEDAAAMVAILGMGATVRNGHNTKHIVWYEGDEDISASESYDEAGRIINERCQ